MVTNNPSQPQIWTGLATYKGAVYRVEVVSNSTLWEAEAKNVVKKAGGWPRSLDNPVAVKLNEMFRISMGETGMRYYVTFKPDKALTDGFMSRKPVTVRLRSNLSRIKDGEFQSVPENLRNPPRPRPVQGQLRRPMRRYP